MIESINMSTSESIKSSSGTSIKSSSNDLLNNNCNKTMIEEGENDLNDSNKSIKKINSNQYEEQKRTEEKKKSSSKYQKVKDLNELVQECRKIFSSNHVDIDQVQNLLYSYQSNPKDWKKYAHFDRHKYTRNLVDTGNGKYNLMLLCWSEGQGSCIHDHANSHCFMKVLSGTLTEIRFAWPESSPGSSKIIQEEKFDHEENVVEDETKSGEKTNEEKKDREEEKNQEGEEKEMKVILETDIGTNDVTYMSDTLGLHRVENKSHVLPAVSLHLYIPPYDSCRIFDQRTGHAMKSNITFYSKGGKKVPTMSKGNNSNSNDGTNGSGLKSGLFKPNFIKYE